VPPADETLVAPQQIPPVAFPAAIAREILRTSSLPAQIKQQVLEAVGD